MKLITQNEAAARLGVSVQTIYRLRRDNKIKSIHGKGRGRVMVLESSIIDYLEGNYGKTKKTTLD